MKRFIIKIEFVYLKCVCPLVIFNVVLFIMSLVVEEAVVEISIKSMFTVKARQLVI